jgi:IS4 transposase
MAGQEEKLQENYNSFLDILSDAELVGLFEKYGIEDIRKRKLSVYHFFWLIILSASEPSARGCILNLIGYFLGAIVLFPSLQEKVGDSLSKSAVSKRLKGVSWYLFRGVYNHLLSKYQHILGATEVQFLGRFKDAFAIDGSVIKLCKQLEQAFSSVHQGKAALKLNVKYSLKWEVLTKLQVSSGKRHDSRFAFVTQVANYLYLIDLGYWSFKRLEKIMDAGSFFVMRLKSSCNPLIVRISDPKFQHLVGKRVSEILDWLKIQTDLTEIEFIVQLSSAKKPRFTKDIRLVGLLHEGEWRFYITNIFDISFTPVAIYQLYALRWQVEIFFNVIKNVLSLQNIISKNKNGIMIEIYAALIFHLLTRIVMALAAQKTGLSIHQFSFERSAKLVKGFLVTNSHLFFHKSLQALDKIFASLINTVANMGKRQNKPHPIIAIEQLLDP